MTNRQVAQAFLQGKPANALHLSTDGKTLFSYHDGYEIAKHRCFEGVDKVIVRTGRMYSLTTAKHKGEVIRAAIQLGMVDDVVNSPTETPKIQAEMNIDGELE